MYIYIKEKRKIDLTHNPEIFLFLLESKINKSQYRNIQEEYS